MFDDSLVHTREELLRSVLGLGLSIIPHANARDFGFHLFAIVGFGPQTLDYESRLMNLAAGITAPCSILHQIKCEGRDSDI
jgi:hypothetical protein